MRHCLEKFPDVGLALAMFEEGERPHPVYYSPKEIYRRHFFERDIFGRAPGASLIRREAFDAVGGFSGLRQVGDFEFYLAICARFPTVSMPVGLTFDRVHADQEQKLNSEEEKNVMRFALVGKQLARADCPLSLGERNTAQRNILKKEYRSALRMAVLQFRPLAAIHYYHDVKKVLLNRSPGHQAADTQ